MLTGLGYSAVEDTVDESAYSSDRCAELVGNVSDEGTAGRVAFFDVCRDSVNAFGNIL